MSVLRSRKKRKHYYGNKKVQPKDLTKKYPQSMINADQQGVM